MNATQGQPLTVFGCANTPSLLLQPVNYLVSSAVEPCLEYSLVIYMNPQDSLLKFR